MYIIMTLYIDQSGGIIELPIVQTKPTVLLF